MNASPPNLPSLIELSFADAITRIANAAELPSSRRSQWTCSLRQVATGLQKSPEQIPARWISIRQAVGKLHHATLGIEAKTLSNHRANANSALAWFAGTADVPRRGAPLSVAWEALRRMLGDSPQRKRLLAFMRFGSSLGIAPEEVDEELVDRFMAYRAEHTRLEIGLASRRALARDWNASVDSLPTWPRRRLIEPLLPSKGVQVGDLPIGLQEDLERYTQGLTQMRRGSRGKRLRPCKASTIRTRRAEVIAFVGKAIQCGIPFDDLTSLSALLHPGIVERVIDAYWQGNGETPTIYTIDLAWKALALARSLGSCNEAALERLDEIRAELEHYRQPGLTEKNRAVIRQVLSDQVWNTVMSLPDRLMREAARRHNQSPVKAAVLAGIAVAIRILVFAPVRIGNLASVRLGENLISPAGVDGPYWLVFPEYEVKNRVPLEFELNAGTTAMINEYLQKFRPTLFRGAPSDCLFPGENGRAKDAKTLSGQITDRVLDATGLRLTAHQFRHAAAAIFLKHRPGEYELVRRLLGHRSIATTMAFYAGLESLQATRIFGDIIGAELKRGMSRQVAARPSRPSQKGQALMLSGKLGSR